MLGLLLGSIWPFACLMLVSLIAGIYINFKPPDRSKYRKY